MTEGRQMRRNSPAMFLVRAAESATTVIPTLVVWLSVRSRWPVWFGVPADLVVGLVAAATVVGLAGTWWATRFTIGADGVGFTTGLLLRRSTSLSWQEVASVQVSQSAAARPLGLYRVTIGIGAASKADLVIEAVPQPVAVEFDTRFRAAGHPDRGGAPCEDETPGRTPRTSGPVSRGHLIYRMRPRDYLALSVTYGQFMLVVPFLYGVYDNVTQLASISPAVAALPDDVASIRVLAVAGLVSAVPVALGFGLAVAWLRYRGFEVRLRDGVFAMSGGLVSTQSRQVPLSQVLGMKVQQNPLMRVCGYARLGFVSRQSGEQIAANVIFPAVRTSFLRDGIRSHFTEYAAALDRPCRVGKGLAWSLVASDTAVVVLAFAALAGLPSATVAVALVALGLTLLMVTNYCWASADVDPDSAVIVFRRGFLWVTRYVFVRDAVYFGRSYQMSTLRQGSVATVCLGLYASRTLRLWVPVGSPGLLDHLTEGTTHAMIIQGGQAS